MAKKSGARRKQESRARQKEQLGPEAFNEKNNAYNRKLQSRLKEEAIVAGTEKSKMPTAIHKRNVREKRDNRLGMGTVQKEQQAKYADQQSRSVTFSKSVPPAIVNKWEGGALELIKDRQQVVQDVGAKESDALALIPDVFRLQQSIVNKVDQFDESTLQTIVNNSFLGKTAYECVQGYKDDRNEEESFVKELVVKYMASTEIVSRCSQSDVDSQDGTTERSDALALVPFVQGYKDDRNEKESVVKELVGKRFTSTEIIGRYSQSDVDSQDGTTERSDGDVDGDGDYNEADDDSSDKEDIYDQDDELNAIKSRELLGEDEQNSRSNDYGHRKQDDEQRLSYDQDNAFASSRNLENTLTSFSSSSSDRSMVKNTAQAPEQFYSNEDIIEIEELDSCNNTSSGNENLCSDVSSSGRKNLLTLQDQYGYSTNIAGLTAEVWGIDKEPIDLFDTKSNAVSSNQGNNPDLGRQSRNQSAGSTALLGNITNTVRSDSRCLTPKNPSSPVSFTPVASSSSSQPMSPVIRKVKDQESSNALRMALEADPLQSKDGVFSQENTGTSMLAYPRLHDVNHFTSENGLPLVGKNGEEEMFVEFDSFGDHPICSPIVRAPLKKRIIARKEHEDGLVGGE